MSIENDGYVFKEKPPAKSSSNVLVNAPGAIACPTCGCRSLGANAKQAIECKKKDCRCKCHES